MEAEKERSEIELALVRDEILALLSEKKFGVFTDDAPKLELAEKGIAVLLKRMLSVEEQSAKHGAVIDQLGAVREALAALQAEHNKATKSLFLRSSANHLASRKQTKHAGELVSRIERIEMMLERLTGTLLERGVIS